MPLDPSVVPPRTPISFDASVAPAADQQASCGKCGTTLRTTYHTVGESMICGKCRATLEGTMIGGTGANRFGRAVLFGIGAAIAGAAVYYAILAATGYSIGILAVLVGYMVGRAVNIGSHGKGGRKYQLLAAFLTYFAMSSTYIVDGVRQLKDEKSGAAVTAGGATATASPDGALAADDVGESAAGVTDAVSATTPAAPSTKTFFFAIIAIVGIVLIAPILAGFSSPILLLILGFGVFQAWKMNRGAAVDISGPFNLRPGTAPAQA